MIFDRKYILSRKKGSFSLREKGRKRGYIIRSLPILYPLSPTLSLWERELIGRMADRSGF
jgi:hypothetical protein